MWYFFENSSHKAHYIFMAWTKFLSFEETIIGLFTDYITVKSSDFQAGTEVSKTIIAYDRDYAY